MVNAPLPVGNSAFHLLVLSLSNAALVGLGLMPEPDSGKRSQDLDLAGQNIEMLAMLEEKTKNNITSEEAQLLEGLLYDLRLQYVEARKQA
jgi:hypothetical protein